MTKILKNGFIALFASMLVCMLAVSSAFAVGSKDEVILDAQGDVVNVSIDGVKTDVSAFSLSLEVDTTADTFDAVSVDFAFSDFINNNTKIHRVTYDTSDSRCFVNIFVAGGNDIFAHDPVQVGTLKLNLDTAKSPGAIVEVKVPEGEALTTVTSGFGEEEGEIYLQSTPTLNLGNVSEIQPPNGGQNGGEGGSGSGSEAGGGKIPSVQPIDDNSNSSKNSTTAGDLARTGDQTPVIPIVLVAVACVAVLLAVIFFRRNNNKKE